MVTTRRVGRWALYAVGGVVAVVLLIRVGLGVYFGTTAGKELVADKIRDRIGMPVEVTSVRLGLFTSSIGLRVFDAAAPDPANAEVLAVTDAGADVSLFDLATGRVAPQKVSLRGVNLTLHVGADGQVLTTLPQTPSGGGSGQWPGVTLDDGRVTIRQDGRPEFAIQHLKLSVEPNGDGLKVAGTLDDPLWAKWTITGDVTSRGKSGSVSLATGDGPLTMDRLGSIPFVPASVWKHVQANGRGAVTLRLWTDSAAETHYSVEIKPNAAALTLPDANATLTHLTGTITVSGSKLTLAGTRAELAGGSIALDGDCDFGPEPTVAHLKVSATNLDIKQLPAEWKLPKDFEGKLKGHADLTLRMYADGRLEPDGGGSGAITGVKVLGFDSDDIPIHLRRAGTQYEFHQEKKTSGRTRPLHEPVACARNPQDKKPADPPKKDAPTTLDATIRLRDIEIAELLKKLDVKFAYKISGKVTAEAKVVVPVGGVTSQAAYQFSGTLSSPALTLEGLTVRELSAHMTYQNGKFNLTELKGLIDQPDKGAPGTLRGTLAAATSPPGDVTADLTIDNVPLGQVAKALPSFPVTVGGTVTGKVSMRAPYETISDPAGWNGSAEVSSRELVIEGRHAKDIVLSVTVAKGEAVLKEAKVTLEGIPITAGATLGLSGQYPFRATVRTTGADVTDLRKLVPEVSLPAPVEGVLQTDTAVTGALAPLAYTAKGSIKATKLKLASSTANHIDAKWELTPEKFVVSELKAEIFSGTISGSADVPFGADKSGKFEVVFKTLDAAAATELVPDVPVKVTGKVSGSVSGTIPPAKDGQARVGNLNLDVTAPKLTVQGIPADRLTGKVTVRNSVIEYELEGKTLGGSFEVNGRYPGQKKDAQPAPAKAPRGSVRLTGVDLSRIAPEMGLRSLAPLAGKVDVSFDFENDFSAGAGTVRVAGLRWNQSQLAREVTGKLTLQDGILRLADVSGRVAGGELRARAQVRPGEIGRNTFTVSLDGAEAKQLFAPISGAAGLIEGSVALAVHGRFGRATHGSGTFTLSRGKVSGAAVTELRLPFDFSTVPGGYGQLAVRDAAASAGTGRARADLTVDWGTETRVNGQVRFTDVPLRTISPELSESSFLGNGRLTGQFDLAGTNVRSADDLIGSLTAALNNASVKEIPLLQGITPFLNPIGLVKPFQAGEIRATLKGGLVRVQRIALSNPAAQVFAEGTITTAGRVDLNVVAHTGTIGPEARGLRLLGLRLPTVGPVPIGLIQDVSDFLSNRTVRLSVTGTTSNPIVRVNVGALLTEEAVRFFLSRYLPAGAAGALGVSGGFGSSK
ncbi:AsmA-like C-terminal region-containing protein [Frigoriglobus tundricola]|uniref:AsmA-like C-terminal domain-containing protein n=1 Tax=Frigoriglobus tundricola TaxID=2774151 RepID=A0A6M5YJN0_9BACT|nr:AsmA-like C-terminal region-containing protein [Frigoriglobus tundricola]QJW93550.1 hypothetical protein FTUN_1057 [Frigoriglobus tundricola]